MLSISSYFSLMTHLLYIHSSYLLYLRYIWRYFLSFFFCNWFKSDSTTLLTTIFYFDFILFSKRKPCLCVCKRFEGQAPKTRSRTKQRIICWYNKEEAKKTHQVTCVKDKKILLACNVFVDHVFSKKEVRSE